MDIKMDIKILLEKEIANLQDYIDKDFFQYDNSKDIELNLANMDAQEFIDKVRKWDFSEMDNAIWHYTRITLLNELLGQEEKLAQELHNTVEVVQQLWQCIQNKYTYNESRIHMRAFQEGKTTTKRLVVIDKGSV